MMGARELLPVFFSYCRRMLRAFLLVALGGATLFVVTILYRAPLELPLYTCCLVGAVGAVFFFSGFVNTVPVTLEEAAYMEGYTAIKIFFKVIMPLTKPSFATVGIFSFIWSYNDLFTQQFFLRNKEQYAITRLLLEISSREGTNYGLMAAVVSLIVVPMLIVYACLQKYIIKGMTAGALKG